MEEFRAVFTKEEEYEYGNKSMLLAALENDSLPTTYLKHWNEKTMQLITPAKV